MCYVFTLVGLYFVLSGVQFWTISYFTVNLKQDEKLTFIMFGLLCMTSPALGSVLSGYIGSKFENGWKTRRAQSILVIGSFLSLFVTLPVIYFSNFYVVYFMLWFLIFFGALIVPGATQSLLSSVEPDIRPQANSIA